MTSNLAVLSCGIAHRNREPHVVGAAAMTMLFSVSVRLSLAAYVNKVQAKLP